MFGLVLATAVGTTGAIPVPRQRLAAPAIASAAEAAVRARLQELGSGARVTVAGRIADQTLPAGKVEVRVGDIQGPLPRPRVGVPVRLLVDGKPVRPMTVWLELSDIREVLVYAVDHDDRTQGTTITLRRASVDMACCHGALVTDGSAIAGLRTRHAVHAGRPVMAADFEPIPAVSASDVVAIRARRGLVSLQTSGVALEDGGIGDRVLVRPDQGRDAVASRVVANREVEISE